MTWLETWLQTPLAGAIGWTLFHSLWQGAIVAVVLAGILAITRSARARYTAACLAMCAILLCFGVTLLRLAPRHAVSGAGGKSDRAPLQTTGPCWPMAPKCRCAALADLLPWLVPFWMAGVALFYLRHLASWALDAASAPEGRLRRSGCLAGTVDSAGARSPALATGCAARILPGASSRGDGPSASRDSDAGGSAHRLARRTDRIHPAA